MSNYKRRMINGLECISEEEFCEQFICTKSAMCRFVFQGMPYHQTAIGFRFWFNVKECQAWFRGEEKEPCSAATEDKARA